MLSLTKAGRPFAEKCVDNLFKACRPGYEPQGAVAHMRLKDHPGFHFLDRGLETQEWAAMVSISLEGAARGIERQLPELVLKAVGRCMLDSQAGTEAFIAKLNEEHALWCRSPVRHYRFAFACDVDPSATAWPVTTLLGLESGVGDAGTVEAIIGVENLEAAWVKCAPEHSEVQIASFAYLVITAGGRDTNEATLAAVEAVELWRACLNCAYSAGQKTIQFGETRPRSRFRACPVMFTVDDQRQVVVTDCMAAGGYGRESLTDSRRDIAAKLLALFAERPAETDSLHRLFRAMLAFQEAIDSWRPADQFLGIWRSVEILSGVVRGDTNEIAKRIGLLWPEQAEEVTGRLRALAPLRNKLVHEGEFDNDEQSPVVMLGHLASIAMMRYSVLAVDFPANEDFNEYYACVTAGDEVLHRKKRVADLVLEMRRR
jgi:hypothetical protein